MILDNVDEKRGFLCLARTVSAGNGSHLEAVTLPYGTDGSYVIPLALMYMRPIQRRLMGLGLCPQKSLQNQSSGFSGDTQGSLLVEMPHQHFEGGNSRPSKCAAANINRSLPARLGDSSQRLLCHRAQVSSMVSPTLKCAETESSPACTPTFYATSTGPSCACQDGQYSGSGLHQQAWGAGFSPTKQTGDQTVGVVSSPFKFNKGSVCAWTHLAYCIL